MFEGTQFHVCFWRLIGVMCILVCTGFGPMAARADQGCGVPSGTRILVMDLVRLAESGQPVSENLGWRMRTLAQHLDHPDIQETLHRTGDSTLVSAMDVLIGTANVLQTGDVVQDSEAMRNAVDVVWNGSQSNCDAEPDSKPFDMNILQPSRTGDQSAFDAGQTQRGALQAARLTGPDVARESQLFQFDAGRFGLLLAGLLITISLVFGARSLHGWIFALRNARKSCKVRADMVVGIEVIDGYITILGQRGCRFKPFNVGAYKRVSDLARTLPAPIEIQIKDHVLAGAIHAMNGEACGIFFDEFLPSSQRADILQLSLVPPKLSPRRGSDPRPISTGTVETPEFEMPKVATEFDAPDLTELADALDAVRPRN